MPSVLQLIKINTAVYCPSIHFVIAKHFLSRTINNPNTAKSFIILKQCMRTFRIQNRHLNPKTHRTIINASVRRLRQGQHISMIKQGRSLVSPFKLLLLVHEALTIFNEGWISKFQREIIITTIQRNILILKPQPKLHILWVRSQKYYKIAQLLSYGTISQIKVLLIFQKHRYNLMNLLHQTFVYQQLLDLIIIIYKIRETCQ